MEMERQLEKEIVINMPPPTLHMKQVPMPVCTYHVLDGSPTGKPVYYATVGQMVYHKWKCEEEQKDTFCMVVHSCFVDDGNGLTLRIKEPGTEYCEVPNCPDPPRRRRSQTSLSSITNEQLSAPEKSDFFIPRDDIIKLNWIQMNFDVSQKAVCMSNAGLFVVGVFNVAIILISATIILLAARLHALNKKLQY
ncbi:hypothetical protein KIN20_012819 [Parelaphostrongylus tenuis]|uniref:Cuticlin C-terminal domain-containing protein n=1 Tax=Parelaphostrongylus tenuis TaxID=148309 RepID=A0AAD5QQP1_PARTN|nr:hypothetical protein KIN20_012819 [Parelaphostrongylus tenuis]